ncbi:MAG: putative rane protein [Glaciihabitans sp.]|nr:putative rane protein [Glaciihabitans sp.]
MSSITRTWLAFAAVGAGMIHLALVISSPLPVGVAEALIGLIELTWGVLAFSRERIEYPRAVLFGSVVPAILWGLLAAIAAAFRTPEIASSLGFVALAVASLLEFFIAVVMAVHVRRATDFRAAPRAPSAGRYLAGLAVGAAVVAALTTPALASTEAGRFAVPHGTHGLTVNLPEHGQH